jgi:hypothetical protein
MIIDMFNHGLLKSHGLISCQSKAKKGRPCRKIEEDHIFLSEGKIIYQNGVRD